VTFITGHEETIAQRFYSIKLFLSTVVLFLLICYRRCD